MRHLLFSSHKLLSSHVELPCMQVPLPSNEIVSDVALITGATGFIGGFLLKELLINNSFKHIYCLARPHETLSGFERVKANLIEKGTSEGLIDPEKITAITGDILQPNFGLEDQLFSRLCYEVDHVFHFAATMNWVTPFNQNTIANIDALKVSLVFCSSKKLKKLHYASSMGLWTLLNHSEGAIMENALHEQGNELPGGYFQSKYVAENILKKAAVLGLPINIYRIGDVKGHSEDGLGDPQNFGNMVMRYFILRGVAIDHDTPEFNFIPVDYLCQSIAHIAVTRTNQTFQFSNPDLISFKDIYNAGLDVGHELKLVSKSEWGKLLYSDKSHEGKQLKPIFKRFTPDQSQPSTSFYEIGVQMFQRPHDTTNTASALAGTQINCPAMIKNQVLQRYLTHLSVSIAKA